MEGNLIFDLFLILSIGLLGGVVTKFIKLPTLAGYILAGVLASAVLPIFGMHEASLINIHSLAELGIILLLFSIGLEISLKRLLKVGRIVFYGSILQMVVTILLSIIGLKIFGIDSGSAIVLAIGFSLSSTAIVIKLLTDRGEKGTIHGEIMVGWLLVQDLAVIPIMALLPLIGEGGNFFVLAGKSLVTAGLAVAAVFVFGRMLVPKIIHKVAELNSRELLSLTAFCIALGTAYLMTLFGVSAALGAFLAGVVISESQENHAVFSEMRPLRDLFVILFFVTLGFLVTPGAIIANLGLIIALTLFVIIVKSIVIAAIMMFSGYFGKSTVATALGLSQVGEFSFVILLAASRLDIVSSEMASVGTAVTLVTILLTPFIFKNIIPIWRKLKSMPSLGKYFWRGYNWEVDDKEFTNHVIVCGYGRVGRWVGKALEIAKVPYVAIDYSQTVVENARKMGVKAIYGDPGEPEVLREADLDSARAVVVAIPDIVSQYDLISYCQSKAPQVKIYARADIEEEIRNIKTLSVERVVQPEFEAAITIAREIFKTMGKSKDDINDKIKSLRVSHAQKV